MILFFSLVILALRYAAFRSGGLQPAIRWSTSKVPLSRKRLSGARVFDFFFYISTDTPVNREHCGENQSEILFNGCGYVPND